MIERTNGMQSKIEKQWFENYKKPKGYFGYFDNKQSANGIGSDFFALKEEQLTINLSTVYRTLESLENKDIVTKITIMDDETHFNIVGHKLYLYGYCEDCQRRNADN